MARPGSGASRRRRKRYSRSDIMLGVAGVFLAAASVAFPWHVYFNPDKYTPPRIAFSGNWNPGVPDEEPPQILAETPTPPVVIARQPDRIITGTTPVMGAESVRAVPEEQQPAPVTGGDYDVIFVVNHTALMSDGSNVFFAEAGKKLPDGSTVTTVAETPAGGEVRTSYDRVYSPGN